jgi:RNA polymerase sigma-70 factor (ECF subfamily)
LVERAAEGDAGCSPGHFDNPEILLMRDTIDADLQQALDELPEAFREAVWMRDVDELSYQEIADALAIPIGTVMSRLSRGRKQLYAALVARRAKVG